MDFVEVVGRRRMVRSFSDRPVEHEFVEGLLDRARRAPTAGNSQAISFVVLAGPAAVATYWDTTLPPERRDRFGWPGLVTAPVLVVVLCSPDAYVTRYGEADKAASGLGVDEAAWGVPYWFVDGGMAVHGLLLSAVDVGLGACFFALFDHEAAVLETLGVPAGWRAVGTVALGYPADADRPGLSQSRPRKPIGQVVHYGRW